MKVSVRGRFGLDCCRCALCGCTLSLSRLFPLGLVALLLTTQGRCALGCGTQKIWGFSQPDVVLITKAGPASSGQPTKDVLHRVAFSGRFGLDRRRCALWLHPASKPAGFLGFGLVS